VHKHAHPDYNLEQWLTLAKRLYRLTALGRIVQDYDVKIAEPMRHPTEPVDIWPAIDALCDVPVSVLRGDLSDILSADTAKALAKRLKNGTVVTIPRTGHPPELDEPASVKAIDALLAKIAA
jgi:pimeloyl-ACP methyl ester carboxylesterase